MPQVSVIVPSFNHAKYLTQRIESILNQTYQDFEVILLDDCSTDKSREILEKYRNHPKVSKIIYNKINSGSTFKQWKLGIDNAIGEYIWIAESDDWCNNKFLEELLPLFQKFPEIVLACCQTIGIDEDGTQIFTTNSKIPEEVYPGDVFIEKYLFGDTAIVNSGMCIFRKDCFFKTNALSFLSFHSAGDWFFWINIARQGKVAVINKELNFFRIRNNSLSHKSIHLGVDYSETLRIFKYVRNEFSFGLKSTIRALELIIRTYISQYRYYKNNKLRFVLFIRSIFLHPYSIVLFTTYILKRKFTC